MVLLFNFAVHKDINLISNNARYVAYDTIDGLSRDCWRRRQAKSQEVVSETATQILIQRNLKVGIPNVNRGEILHSGNVTSMTKTCQWRFQQDGKFDIIQVRSTYLPGFLAFLSRKIHVKVKHCMATNLSLFNDGNIKAS